MNKEELVLVVCRTNTSVQILEPLQLIIPTLRMTAPFSLYTSDGLKITSLDMYSTLAEALASPANTSLSQTLRSILKERDQNNFRVCIFGGMQVNWDIVLQYKRRKILIDTVGMNEVLSQVSHTTGGISKVVTKQNVIKTFLTDFTMSTVTRKYYLLKENSIVKFHLQPICCKQKPLSSEFYACSICMHIYCPEHYPKVKTCFNCGYQFDPEVKVDTEQVHEIPLVQSEDMNEEKIVVV